MVPPMISRRLVLAVLLLCRFGVGWKADIRADSNRDGRVDIDGNTDLADKDEWSDLAGALFLANIGDTDGRCSQIALSGDRLSDEALAACNDASDDIQRSPGYMALIRTVPIQGLEDGAWANVQVTEEISRKNVRLFRQEQDEWIITTNDYKFNASELEAGLNLGIDARDTRRPSGWDGRAQVHLHVQNELEVQVDDVYLRVAPILTSHHLMDVSEVLTANVNDSKAQIKFVSDLRDILNDPNLKKPLWLFNHSDDVWAQDFVEPAYTSMPGSEGPITLEVMIRSSQGSRTAGRQVFEYLRKTGRGAVYSTGGTRNEIDSMGNLETIPPYSFKDKSFPAGRIIEGSHAKSYPSYPHVYDYMKAQEFQEPLVLDTDWLAVGHVDEIVQFLPANTPYGWALYIADLRAGIKILEDAKEQHGDTPAFSRLNDTYTREGLGDVPGLTIAELLTDKLISATKDLLRNSTPS
ncbi:hypothetical protein ONZ43_g4551 [Nemania bipapillata]|uniref:Uncharacterized protein n=1 Tax=Nemania bipapillata TaxID=110536 RepID=A0ACC2IL57_9PEZI|nr:hypothetical protein ONZ43_g4551 [Nemania bipapillata]